MKLLAVTTSFALLAACAPSKHAGPTALWSSSAAAHDNPTPDERAPLDPERWFDELPKAAWTSASETTLHAWTAALAADDGWGLYAPVFIRFSSEPKHIDAAQIAFVVDASHTIAAVSTWIADPGFLLVRPALPLPPDARILVALERGQDDLNRSDDYDAFCAHDPRDVDEAAHALGVDANDLALVFAYQTASPSKELAAAFGMAKSKVPAFHFDAPVAPSQLPSDLRAHTSKLPAGARVAVGTWTERDFRPTTPGPIDLTATPRDVTLDVLYALPDASQFPPPWPAVVAQHGFGGDRTFGLDVADELLQRGIAVFSIDASSHGNRGSYFAFFDVTDPRIARDHIRQTAIDDVELATLLRQGHIDVDGVPGDDLDGTISFFGHSMGAIVGGTVVAADHDWHAAVLNAPGAAFFDIFQSVRLKSAVGLLLKPAFGLSVDDDAAYDDTLPVAGTLLQSLMEGADPMAFSSVRERVKPLLLVQMNVGDQTLPNASALVMAQAYGIDVVDEAGTATVARDGLWQLDPAAFGFPADQDPHGMHTFAGAPGIHAQMAEFFRSGGTVLLDPTAAR